jgi:hypothetical protein
VFILKFRWSMKREEARKLQLLVEDPPEYTFCGEEQAKERNL